VPKDLRLTHENSTPAAAPSSNTPTNLAVTARTNPPSTTPTYVVPQEQWIPLGRWARASKAGSLTNLAANGHRTFGLETPEGLFVVRTESVLAQWCGMELRLGFEPRLVGEEPFLNRLDLEKNLIPLLDPKPELPTRGVIVLDPGHGGADSGTRSAKGQLEKEYTLDWALRLEALLKAAGWKVYLTRTSDVQLALADRVTLADKRKASLFLSLHFNAASLPQHAGIETYCVTPTGMPSNVTRGYEDNAALVFPNNEFDAQNLQLAVKLHRALLRATGSNDRGVRRARFLSVLRAQHCPAVLVEGGYLSNPEEADRIATPEYRQLLAEAVAKALQ